MPTTSDEGCGNPPARNPPAGPRIYESTQGLTLEAQGRQSPVGFTRKFHVTPRSTLVGERAVAWNHIEIPTFYLSQAASLLVLQGLPLSQLFPPDSRLEDLAGPFALLSADTRELHSGAPRLRFVVLAQVTVEDFIPEVVTALVETLMAKA